MDHILTSSSFYILLYMDWLTFASHIRGLNNGVLLCMIWCLCKKKTPISEKEIAHSLCSKCSSISSLLRLASQSNIFSWTIVLTCHFWCSFSLYIGVVEHVIKAKSWSQDRRASFFWWKMRILSPMKPHYRNYFKSPLSDYFSAIRFRRLILIRLRLHWLALLDESGLPNVLCPGSIKTYTHNKN